MKRSATDKAFILLIQLAAIAATTIFVQVALAQEIPFAASPPATIYYTTSGAEPISEPTTDSSRKAAENERKNKELKKKLLKKYGLDKDTLTIRLEHTQHGPKGYISMWRNRSPGHDNDTKDTPVIKENTHSRVTSIVREFLTEEAELFGIADLNELREIHYETDVRGLTSIRFQRYIDQLPLENSTIQFFVRSSGEVSEVSARLSPSSPELYEAVKKETLSEERIRAIAEETLRGVGFDVTINPYMRQYIKAHKVAIATPPYVLWKVESYWNLVINAFTGEVIEKYSNIMR